MKTLTLLGYTTCLAVALSACGTDPILLGEILDSAGDGSGSSGDDPAPPDAEPTPDDVDPQPEEPETPELEDSLEDIALDILRVNCGNCHIGTDAAGEFGYVTDVDRMIEDGKIVPGSKEDSRIYARMVTQSMPPLSVQDQRPTPGQIELIGLYIDRLEYP